MKQVFIKRTVIRSYEVGNVLNDRTFEIRNVNIVNKEELIDCFFRWKVSTRLDYIDN